MEYHYTAREAIKRLGLPRSTFYYLIRSGQIHKIDVPLRKQSLYVKHEIDRLAAEREQILSRRETTRRMLTFSIPSMSDVGQMFEIWMLWAEPGDLLWFNDAPEWQHYNPEVMHVLKDTSTDTVLGGVVMSPLKEEVLRTMRDLRVLTPISKPSDCLPFEAPDHALIEIYVFDLLARPSIRKFPPGALLLRGTLRFLESLLDRGIAVRRIFAVGVSPHAHRLARKLGFVYMHMPYEIPVGGRGQRYVLDLLDPNPKSKLVAAYQRSFQNQRRRARRYQQTAIETNTTQDG